MIDFSRFEIVGADGNVYRGIRPSLVPKPFISIKYVCPSGLIIYPLIPNDPDDVLGYDGSLQVSMGSDNSTRIAVRMITILKNGERVYALYHARTAILISSGKLMED